MKKLLLFISLLLCGIEVLAQHRTELVARQIAEQFFSERPAHYKARLAIVPQAQVRAKLNLHLAKAKQVPAQNSACYIINDEANNRFVVVSADERMYEVLGYSDNGTFDVFNTPLALLDLLAEYDYQYSSLGTAKVRKGKVSSGAKFDSVGPLLKSDWGQRSPFNDRCPINVSLPDNQRSVSGCVATAMAQVMNYHEHPKDEGRGKFSYVTRFGSTLSMDYDTLRLDWNLIKDSYQSADRTAEECAEVAKLMLACGISVSMNYGQEKDNQSGAYSENLPYALINYFKYNTNTLFKKKDYYTDEEWNEMIMRELQAGHPILYAGCMGSLTFGDFGGVGFGGHQFVLDGCDSDGRFHMNYGWNGTSNAYFYLTSSDKFTFSYYQDMVYQITPEEYGEREDVFYASDFSVNRRSIPIGERVKFSFYPKCYSFETTLREPGTNSFNGEVGVGLFDDNFNFIETLYSLQVNDLRIGDGQSVNANIPLDGSRFMDGTTYKIAPYAKSVNATHPTRVRTSRTEQDYYQAIVEDGTVKLLLKGQEFNEVLTGRYKAMAINMNGETEEWYVNLRRYFNDNDAKYEILDIDPVAGKFSTSSYNRNRMIGDVNADGTQISFITGSLGDDIKLTNYSGNKSIVVHLDSKKGIMYIDDVWGCTMTEDGGSSASAKELSRYSNTIFTYIDAVDVESPVVEVTSDNIMTLSSVSEDAVIYYTLDGSTPTMYNATIYSGPIKLTHNCTVKAMAFKSDNFSEVTTYDVNWFTVATPAISFDEETKKVTITTETSDAVIYYTTDETAPTDNSTKYEEPFTCETTCILKAIALKADFNNSQEVSKLIATGEDERNIKITDNVAGELASRIPESNRSELLALTVTGELNGTDIKLIRDMLQNGKIYVLNLKDACIVAGGEKYDGIYSTENDVIGSQMFSYSKHLQLLNLPKGIKEIGSGAFRFCNNLNQLELPEAVKTIDGFAFANNNSFEYFEVAPNNPWIKSINGVVYSKDESVLIAYPVKKMDTSYSILNGVTMIASNAFSDSQIREVIIPETVTTISHRSFNNCNNLKDVIIPNSVTTIGDNAFFQCKSLETVTMSSNVKTIGTSTFGFCSNLRYFHFGKAVESIDRLAFTNCSSLLEFVVDEKNEHYRSLNGIVYSKDMKQLVVFPRGRYEELLTIPEGVETICENAFDGCHNVKSFCLPQSLKTIEKSAFKGCMMYSINLPQGTSTIKEYAFQDCNNLEIFVIPNSIERVENGFLFLCSKLSYIYIPAGIAYIGSSAFRSCEQLTVINSKIKDIDAVDFNTSQWEPISNAFERIPVDCTWRILSGPAGDEERYADRYKVQPWWVDTWKIILEPDDTTVGIEENIDYPVDVVLREGRIEIIAKNDGVLKVYSINGSAAKNIFVKKDERRQLILPKGMYIVDGKKIFVK